VKTVSDKVVRH